MKKSQFLILLVFLVSGWFYSCGWIEGRKNDPRVARVGKNYLYQSDLKGIVPVGTTPADSTIIIKRYIDNWIRQQIYLKEAESSLTPEDIDFKRKVEDYRNSLIIFTHENKIVASQLDTVVSPDLLAEYYEKHQSEFKLRDHIVKLNYIKVPLDAPEINRVRRLIRSEEPNDISELEEYAINHAAGYFLDQESWFIFNDILRDIPINPQNQESFLRNNRFLELNDQYYRYFLFIRDYKLEGSVSPLAFQSENIKAIILNHRRQAFVNDFRQNAYKNAAQNQLFEIY
jgi:hypothetical protein